MPNEPTLGEVWRRQDRTEADLSAVKAQQANFVTQREYDREMRDVKDDVTDLQEAREDDKSWRRSAGLAIALAAIGWVLTIGLAVLALVKGN